MCKFFLGLSVVLLIICAYLLNQNYKKTEQVKVLTVELQETVSFTNALLNQCLAIEAELKRHKQRII